MTRDAHSRSPGGTAPPSSVQRRGADAIGKRSLVEQIETAASVAGVVQRRSSDEPGEASVHAAAAQGIATPASALPYSDAIQRAFGRHDVASVQAHTGPAAAQSAQAMGAQAYAAGNHVVLGERADLHTVAHEAAHVVQQRGGVQLKGGVGEHGDSYEQHADAVADRVVLGQSAEALLDQMAPPGAPAGGAGGPVQRLVIPANEHPEFAGAIDTEDYAAAARTIDIMAQSSHKAGLKYLRGVLNGRASGAPGAGKLRTLVDGKLAHWTTSEDKPKMGSSDVAAKIAAAMLGLPDADPEIQRRLNMWVVGDPNRGINWAMIGGHLRGRLDAQAYELIGYQIHVIDNRARVGRGEAEDPEPSAAEQAIGGTAALNAVRDDIRAALDDLPNFVGRSYRISGIANAGVYSGQIKEGDLIKDTTFWSTSLVRGSSGAAGAWGADGTAEKPKAYFIIDGATGKYIAKYSQVKGEQEVLFKDNTVFKVNRVVNDKSSSTTFFVYISQVTAATGALQIKNPYDGTVQP